MRTRDLPIGVFDSGVGGLTVLRTLVDRLPNERMIYLGDTARVPYGNRAANTVQRYARNATHLLEERGIKALVVACNTASAYALESLVDLYDIPVVGVIDPVAARAASATTTQSIGVLGTRGTVRSNCYPDALARYAPEAAVHQVPSPLLVPLAEEGWTRGEVPRRVAEQYVGELRGSNIDTLILGCTHYPLLEAVLSRATDEILGDGVELLDSASATADALRNRLDREALASSTDDPSESPSPDFLFTDVSPAFEKMAERFFGATPGSIHHVDIEDVS